jgi:hypothetical protein
MEGQQGAAVPTEADLEKTARALLAAGRAVLPIKIDGIPLKAGSSKRHFTHIEVSDTDFVRMWLASLLHRTLDAYESTLLLWEKRLDLDARAHIRNRPLRIARHGLEFYERQMTEMSKHRELSEHRGGCQRSSLTERRRLALGTRTCSVALVPLCIRPRSALNLCWLEYRGPL